MSASQEGIEHPLVAAEEGVPARRLALTEMWEQQPAPIMPATPQAMQIVQPTMLSVLNSAIAQPGFNVGALEKLMELYERNEAREAAAEYARDMAEFKKNAPVIYKDRHVFYETKGPDKPDMDYNHASLGHIVETLVPALARYGFSHSWRPGVEGERLTITCVLTHRRGHKEEFKRTAPADRGPGRNFIQAEASATTYLQRYTLLDAVGLAPQDMPDDDGHNAGQTDPRKDPSIIRVDDDTPWYIMIEGQWTYAMSPQQDGKLEKHAAEGVPYMWDLWMKHPKHAGLCGYWADWLYNECEQRGKGWADLREIAANKPTNPFKLPESRKRATPEQLVQTCAMIRKQILREQQQQTNTDEEQTPTPNTTPTP